MTDLLSMRAQRPTEEPQPMMLSATRAKSLICAPPPDYNMDVASLAKTRALQYSHACSDHLYNYHYQ